MVVSLTAALPRSSGEAELRHLAGFALGLVVVHAGATGRVVGQLPGAMEHGQAPVGIFVDSDLGVLGIFRPKTTRIAESPAIRGLPGGITFPEPVNIPRLCASVPPDPVVFHSFRRYRYPSS